MKGDRIVQKVSQSSVKGNMGRRRPQKREDVLNDWLIGKGSNEREGVLLPRDRFGERFFTSLCSQFGDFLSASSNYVRSIHQPM